MIPRMRLVRMLVMTAMPMMNSRLSSTWSLMYSLIVTVSLIANCDLLGSVMLVASCCSWNTSMMVGIIDMPCSAHKSPSSKSFSVPLVLVSFLEAK